MIIVHTFSKCFHGAIVTGLKEGDNLYILDVFTESSLKTTKLPLTPSLFSRKDV